jgi:hypothetical protein
VTTFVKVLFIVKLEVSIRLNIHDNFIYAASVNFAALVNDALALLVI